MKSFEQIADMPMDDIKPPPLLPVGTYLVGIVNTPEQFTSSQKQTPGVRFPLRIFQARDDVDQRELQQVLEEREMKLTDFELNDEFYITDNSAFMMTTFLQKVLGFPGNIGMRQAWAECSGKQYLIHIRHRPTQRQDGSTGLRAEIDSRTPAT